jgi:hypothetical protein
VFQTSISLVVMKRALKWLNIVFNIMVYNLFLSGKVDGKEDAPY